MDDLIYDGPPKLFSLPDGSVREIRKGERIPPGAQMTWRVPLLAKDSQPHWGTPMTDEDHDDRYELQQRRKREIADAWKTPQAASPDSIGQPFSSPQPSASATTAEDAHAQMVARMTNAWKDPSNVCR